MYAEKPHDYLCLECQRHQKKELFAICIAFTVSNIAIILKKQESEAKKLHEPGIMVP